MLFHAHNHIERHVGPWIYLVIHRRAYIFDDRYIQVPGRKMQPASGS